MKYHFKSGPNNYTIDMDKPVDSCVSSWDSEIIHGGADLYIDPITGEEFLISLKNRPTVIVDTLNGFIELECKSDAELDEEDNKTLKLENAHDTIYGAALDYATQYTHLKGQFETAVWSRGTEAAWDDFARGLSQAKDKLHQEITRAIGEL